MVQIRILSGKKAGAEYAFSHFPILIGRSPDAHLCLDEPGLWDRHCEIAWSEPTGLFARIQPGVLGRLNGENIQEALLRNGDLLSLGALQIRFSLTPVRQRSLLLREWLTWIALAGLCLGQVALIYRLLE